MPKWFTFKLAFIAYAEFMGESELDTFLTGFRLGARFMMDTF